MRRKRAIAVLACFLLVGCAAVSYWFWEWHRGGASPRDDEGTQLVEFSPRPPILPYLEIDVPDGYELSRDDGPDFDVYYVRPASTDPAKGAMGVYVGWWPNSFRPETGCKEESASLCGKDVTWYSWSGDDGDSHREGYLTLTNEDGGGTIHAFISSKDQTQLAILRRTAATIRLTDERKDIPRPQAQTHPATSMPASQVGE